MFRLAAASAALLVATSASAQTPPPVEGPPLKLEPPPKVKWLGPKPHFKVEGRVAGENIKYDLDASNIGRFWCEREYLVPRDEKGEQDFKRGRLHEIKVEAVLNLSERHFRVELELKRHDFQRAKPGVPIKIIPRNDTIEPKKNEMWLEWEWHAVDAMSKGTWENFESAGVVGTFTLGTYTGTPGPDGLVVPEKTGIIGGTFETTFSPTEKLAGSFTVQCRTNRVGGSYL